MFQIPSAKVLWLMPIQPISKEKRKGTLGSYYSIADYKAVNPEFGTAADFKALVDKAHGMGFKIVLDWVPNHTGWDNPWITKNPEWYTKNSAGQIIHPEGTDWTDVADLNYSNQAMRAEMIASMKHWVDTYDIDGFRVDVAGAVPDDFWKTATETLTAIKPLWMLAEAQVGDVEIGRDFSSAYNWPLKDTFNGLKSGASDRWNIGYEISNIKSNYPKGTYPMNFVTNHDENSWNGTVEKRIGNNAHAAFMLCVTMSQGMPLIYSGQEVGLNKSLRFFERDTIDWSAPSQADFYSKALALKTTQGALANGSWGGAQTRITTNHPSVYAFSRVKGDNIVTVFVNFSAEEVTVDYSGAIDEDYTNWFTGEEAELEEDGQITLPANGYLVLTHGEC